MNEFSNDEPNLRLCCLRKIEGFQGYGFDLRNLKNRTGHYIGKIDEGSPAAGAGLRLNDRIVEINGINIANENHYQVVERIKAVPTETRLLVVDPATDEYYRERDVKLNGNMPCIIYMENRPADGEIDNNANANLEVRKIKTARDVRLPPNLPAPRLCYLVMWPDVEGYGFTLHMEKGKVGQYIGEVSSDTPAYAAGLQTGDRILAVNGRNVIGDSHKEVVRKMKELPGELRLLLCQPKMEEYLRVNDIVLSEDVPGIVVIKCPPTNPQLDVYIPPIARVPEMKKVEPAVYKPSQPQPSHDSGDEHSTTSSRSSPVPMLANDISISRSPNAYLPPSPKQTPSHGLTSSDQVSHELQERNESERHELPVVDSFELPPSNSISPQYESPVPSRTEVVDSSRNSPHVASPSAGNYNNNNNTSYNNNKRIHSLPVESLSITTSAANRQQNSYGEKAVINDAAYGESQRVTLAAGVATTRHTTAFAMSAAEAREQMRMQRSRDRARISTMSTDEKYSIYKQL